MIAIDVTLWVQMVNFLLFLVVMNVILYRPIRRMVAKRNQFVAEQRKGIDQAAQEAEDAVREFEETLKNARLAGRKRVEEYKDAARQQEKDLLQKAYQEAGEEVARVREEVIREKEQALRELRQQIEMFSLDVAGKILGRSLS